MKNLSFSLVGFIAALSTMFVACSQNEDVMGSENMTPDGEVVYNLHLECSAPGYDEDLKTRGATSWEKGSIVYLIFNNGITGTATYDGSEWTLKASSSLGTTSAATKCAAAYVENPESSSTNSTVKMGAGSILYRGDGTYTSNSTDIYVNVTLTPATWRLRFKGKSGTKITLPAASNDIRYYTAMTISTLNTTVATTDVTLTVNSNGYTNYIYGELSNKNGNNTVFLVNESEGSEYYRENISGNTLSAGKSAYLTIPTESTYASLGWETVVKTDPNATVVPDIMMIDMEEIITDWTFGSTATAFNYIVYEGTYKGSDTELIEELKEGCYNVAEYSTYSFSYTGLSENTAHTLYAVAFNSEGVNGELLKMPFTTKSSSAPIVPLSDLSAGEIQDGTPAWRFYVYFKNNTTKYYLARWLTEYHYEVEDFWNAYWTYRKIMLGEDYIENVFRLEKDLELSGNLYFNRGEESHCSLVSFAVDSNGNLGNWSCVKATTTSYANGVRKVAGSNGKGDNRQCAREPKQIESSTLQPYYSRTLGVVKQ